MLPGVIGGGDAALKEWICGKTFACSWTGMAGAWPRPGAPGSCHLLGHGLRSINPAYDFLAALQVDAKACEQSQRPIGHGSRHDVGGCNSVHTYGPTLNQHRRA